MICFDPSRGGAGGGRTGLLRTPHGNVRTPAFMPVGTYGTVRGLVPAQLTEAGVEILLANAYHLALRPGAETISKLGGLHRFMGWGGPILTDSGGYQLFSLSSRVRIEERGAIFRSHLDGAPFELSPERAVEIQRQLAVDIGMVFDVVTGEPGDRHAAALAGERTVRWARRSRASFEDSEPTAFFAIMQGGLFEDLRRENAEAIAELGFPGYAVGGLSVGESREETMATAAYCVEMLPEHKPRYMMGMGTPLDLVELCGQGYDLFDCVIPTRNGRNGSLFTSTGPIAIRNAAHAEADAAVDDDCDCYCCRRFPRAYLHHLARRKEMLGATLATIHNVRFYQRLMGRIREALDEGRYAAFKGEFTARYAETEQPGDQGGGS